MFKKLKNNLSKNNISTIFKMVLFDHFESALHLVSKMGFTAFSLNFFDALNSLFAQRKPRIVENSSKTPIRVEPILEQDKYWHF